MLKPPRVLVLFFFSLPPARWLVLRPAGGLVANYVAKSGIGHLVGLTPRQGTQGQHPVGGRPLGPAGWHECKAK